MGRVMLGGPLPPPLPGPGGPPIPAPWFVASATVARYMRFLCNSLWYLKYIIFINEYLITGVKLWLKCQTNNTHWMIDQMEYALFENWEYFSCVYRPQIDPRSRSKLTNYKHQSQEQDFNRKFHILDTATHKSITERSYSPHADHIQSMIWTYIWAAL